MKTLKIIYYLPILFIMSSCHSEEKIDDVEDDDTSTVAPEPEPGDTDCKAWSDFVESNKDNILLDFHTPDINMVKRHRLMYGHWGIRYMMLQTTGLYLMTASRTERLY